MQADLLQGFYLEDLLVEPTKGRVTGRAGSSHLPPKAVEVLLCLASTPGELVTRDALLDAVWGVGLGSQEALSHAVSEIRQALQDHYDEPRFVQTLPKRGYRLLLTPRLASEDTGTVVLGAGQGASLADVGLFENLRQRGVLETALAYLIVGWLLIQVADIVFGQLHMPAWAGTFVTLLVIGGFPIALILSWYLEFRDGKAVVHQLSPADARRRRFGRTYLSVVAGFAVAGVIVAIVGQSVGLPEPRNRIAAELAITAPPIVENSFAVLPFLNLDGSEETGIFANGLVDDVITQLAHVPGLRVASRGDSFTLEPNTSSQKVRERLRVEMYLEGSVEMADDQIRVVVQLIDSESGFHVLSRRFDKERSNFFEIRDEITSLTVANVRVALPPDTRMSSLQSTEPPVLDAYLLYRRGVDASNNAVSMDSITAALGWYDAALEVDPEYAAAYAGKCETFVSAYSEVDDASMVEKAESACFKALALNPNLDVVHTSLGQLGLLNGRLRDAEASFRRALEVDPSSSDSLIGLGEVYLALNRPEDAEEYLRLAVGLHPGDWAAYNRYGKFLYRQGRYSEASEQYASVIALDHENMNAYSNLGASYMLDANFIAALPAFERSLAIEPKKTTYSNLGLMHYYLGNLEQSISNHRSAIDLEPNDYLAWSNLGDAMSIAGDASGATEAFETALDLATSTLQTNPNNAYTMMDLAWINAMLGNNDEAGNWIARVRELAPEDPYTHYYDGLILFSRGDTDGAVFAFSEAVDKGYSPKLLAAEPRIASLHGDTRFLQLLENE